MTTSRDTHCPQDGFPLVEIDGIVHCSVEYADSIIGGQAVTGVQELGGFIYISFENGASIPLTCPCCGGELHLRSLSLKQLGNMFTGRTLEGFRHGEWVGRGLNAARHPIFALQFAGEEDLSARTLQVHLESLRGLSEVAIKQPYSRN